MKRGRLFVKYCVLGVDGFSLISALSAKGVATYGIKALDQKTYFSIDFCDCKKLFAISRNMCYNITRVKYYGKLSPLLKTFKNIGFALCFACFALLMKAFDGYVSEIKYIGDAVYLKPKIERVFLSEGVTARGFYTFDGDELAKKILMSSEDFSFVSVKKSGRILLVEAYEKTQTNSPISVKKEKITSPVNGVVKSINLLGGSARINVGDEVEEGAVLIDGVYESDGKEYSSYALGEVLIVAKYEYTYKSFSKGEKYKSRAIAVAVNSLGEEVIETEVKEIINGEEIYYQVTLYYEVLAS